MSDAPRRNDPCPCGSGRKYKNCHLGRELADRDERTEAARLGTLGGEVTNAIWEFAWERFGEDWADPAFELFFEQEGVLQLLVPFAVHHVPIEGRTAAEWYADAHGPDLSEEERACLDAEREAWLSLWQVIEARPGDGLVLRDRLSGEVRDVVERTASRSLKAGQNILARLVELGDFVSINGMYPLALAEPTAADVERRTRGHLRRKRDVPVERLREPGTMRYLIRRVVEEGEALLAGPTLVNNDGDPILLTTDHFDVDADARAEVARRLAALPRVMGPEPDDGGGESFVFLGRGDLLLGQALLTGRRLQLSTNSVERADRLRRQIERACKGLLQHRAREHVDPLSTELRDEGEDPALEATSPEMRALVRTVKQQHYAEWVDIPLPALGDETPRAAVATPEGRARVEALLADFEEAERSLDAEDRVDFDVVRRELGLLEPPRGGG